MLRTLPVFVVIPAVVAHGHMSPPFTAQPGKNPDDLEQSTGVIHWYSKGHDNRTPPLPYLPDPTPY